MACVLRLSSFPELTFHILFYTGQMAILEIAVRTIFPIHPHGAITIIKMKTYIVGLLIAMALLISGCHSGNKHESSSDAKDAHQHRHDHGHSHSHDHDHDHSSGDTDAILFTRQQAEMTGLEVEQVAPAPFSYVIKTSGQIQAAQGDEVIIAATSNGIVSFTNPSLTDGGAVRSGQSIVTISGPG